MDNALLSDRFLILFWKSPPSPHVFCSVHPVLCFPIFPVPWFSPVSRCQSSNWLFSPAFPCSLVSSAVKQDSPLQSLWGVMWRMMFGAKNVVRCKHTNKPRALTELIHWEGEALTCTDLCHINLKSVCNSSVRCIHSIRWKTSADCTQVAWTLAPIEWLILPGFLSITAAAS